MYVFYTNVYFYIFFFLSKEISLVSRCVHRKTFLINANGFYLDNVLAAIAANGGEKKIVTEKGQNNTK